MSLVRNSLFLLLGLVFLAACSQAGAARLSQQTEQGAYTVAIQLQEPMKSGRNDTEVTIHDRQGQPVSGAAVKVTPWMPAMGHGVMFSPKVVDKGNGVYDVYIFLSMGGKWEITFEIGQGGSKDMTRFDFQDVLDADPKKHG